MNPLNFHSGFPWSNYLEMLKNIDPFQTNSILYKNLVIYLSFGILSVFPDIMSSRVIFDERRENFSELEKMFSCWYMYIQNEFDK